MILSIQGVRDVGMPERERVVLIATEKGSIGNLVATAAKAGPDRSFLVSRGLWLPTIDVNQGDLVILYSKEGDHKKKENSSGKNSYFFYYNSQTTLWNKDEVFVLLSIDSWQHRDPGEDDADDLE